MDSEAFTEVFEGGPEIPEREAVICKWIAKLQNDCPRFCALVVGQTGVGKSTLINNLLGEDVAGVGSNLTSCTPAVRSYEGVVKGVPVKLIDTPGLDDATTGNDERNVEEIRRLLQEENIHLIIYCTKISETRLHKGIIRTFKKYTEIGVDWEKTVIALTFADGLCPPSSMKEIPGFNIGTYFEDKVTEWRREIPKALAEVVHLREEEVTQIKINPTISASGDLLPNGKEWYNAFWLDVLAVLNPGALMQFVHCHRQNIKCTETREAPEWPENFTLSPPPPDEKKIASSCEPPYKPSMESNTTKPRSRNPVIVHENWPENFTRSPPPPDEGKIASSCKPPCKASLESNTTQPRSRKPVIVLKGEERDRFEHILGKALLKAAGVAAVGGVAGATVAGVAGVASGALAGTVSAPVVVPVVAVGAVAGVAVGALGATVVILIGLWKHSAKKR